MMSLCAGRSTAGTALERGGFALAYAVWRLRLGLRLRFLEGVGVLEEAREGLRKTKRTRIYIRTRFLPY
jgi:hypothetical protein